MFKSTEILCLPKYSLVDEQGLPYNGNIFSIFEDITVNADLSKFYGNEQIDIYVEASTMFGESQVQ